MKILRYNAPRNAEIVEKETPKPAAGQILTKSLYCNISAGTEMGFYRGTAPQMNSILDSRYNFTHKENAVTYPMCSDGPRQWYLGYANISQVVEIGDKVEGFNIGDCVYAQVGHKDFQLINFDGCLKLPGKCNFENASLTALCETTYNGILDANLIYKETVVIFGLGTLGQLILQMAKKSGCRVVAVDGLSNRLELAKKCGADKCLNFRECDVADEVYKLTDDRGADAVFEVTGNISALPAAMKTCCRNGRVIVLSFYQGGAPDLHLGQEFHLKRISLISSQIGGINPLLSNRWDKKRRLKTAFELTQELQITPLITHRIRFEDLPKTLAMIDKNPSECGTVCIKY